MCGLKPSFLLLQQSDRPIFLTTFSFASGIVASLLCKHYLFEGLAAGGIILVVAAAMAYRQNKIFKSFVLVHAAIFAGGMTMGLAHRDGHDTVHLQTLISRNAFPLNEPVLFEGRISEEGPEQKNEIELIVNLLRYQQKGRWFECNGKGILRIAASDQKEQRQLLATLRPGSKLRSWAVWKKPRNFENPGSFDRTGFLGRRGIFLTGRTKSPRLIESLSEEFPGLPAVTAQFVRTRVRSILNPIHERGKRQSAAILQSLLIGDRSALHRKTREIFQNSGSFHILVVSGLHIAWITGAWLILSKAIRIPETSRYLSAAVVILLYTWTVGSQPAITRCLWMFFLYLIGRMLLRHTDSVNILFSAALMLLVVDPDRLFEAGYQLSFLSVAAIVMTAIPVMENRLKPILQPMRNTGRPERLFLKTGSAHRWGRRLRIRCELFSEKIADLIPFIKPSVLCFLFRCMAAFGFALGSMIMLSVFVQLWIAPLLAFYFNRISWIAPLSNPVLVPIASATLASGSLAVVFDKMPFFGPALAQFAGITASFLLESAEFITKIPYSWQRCPTPHAGFISGGILLLLSWTFFKWKRYRIPFGYNLLLIVLLACGGGPYAGSISRSMRDILTVVRKDPWLNTSSSLSLTLLDVGEGDSIVLRFPNGQLWILDTGGLRSTSFGEDSEDAFDVGEAVVSRYLWQEWGNVPDRVVLSHTDIDHAGGLTALLNNFRIRRLDYPRSIPDKLLLEILQTARGRGTLTNPVSKGAIEKVGETIVRVLHPPAYPLQPSTNDNSAVLKVSFKRFSAILPGDLERHGEAELLAYSGDLRSHLLKVAHHGSASGTSSTFLDVVKPRWAIISSGYNNPFGHPAPSVLSRLSSRGTHVYQTANEGAVTFITDGIRYEIRSHIHGILEKGELE